MSQDAEGYRILNASPIYWAAINAIQEFNGKVEQGEAARREEFKATDARHKTLQTQNAASQQQIAELETRLRALEKTLKPLSMAKE